MAYTSGFFDAIDQGGGNYDRVYSASSFAHYFSLLVKNGVFPDPSTGMQVKASSSPDMHVYVQPGSGWVNGYYITVGDNAPEQLTVPTANPSLSRIDSVIMGLNYVDREIQLYIKSGAVSASPSAVSLQRDNDLYELELAQITVGAGVASISQTSITDMRQNTSRCGIVAGTIDQIDTTDLFAQYNAAFQAWFDDLKAQLGDNVATNLQNQINTLKNDKVDVADKASKDQAQAGTNNTKWMTPALVKAWWDSLYSSLVLPVSKGGTGSTTNKAALAALQGVSQLVSFHQTADVSNLDTLVESSMLVNLSTGVNAELYNLFGGKDLYAYVLQLNHASISTGNPRVQIAIGYTTQRMAVRQYYTSWNNWKLVRIDDPLNMVTLVDLLRVASPDSGTEIDIPITVSSCVYAGNSVPSGSTAKLKNNGDYVDFTLNIPEAAANRFLFYLDRYKFTLGGSSSYASKDTFYLLVGGSSYYIGQSIIDGYNNNFQGAQIAIPAGIVPTTASIRIRERCIATSDSSISFGAVGQSTGTIKARALTIKGGII